MAVSTKEQKLSWEFMRAIESASRKGRVILVIDGVTQLESSLFARLKWLPLNFPANVRVILSATVSSTEMALATGGPLKSPTRASTASAQASLADDSDDGGMDSTTVGGAGRNASTMNKEIAELTRRGWHMIQVRCRLRVRKQQWLCLVSGVMTGTELR